MSAVMPGLKDTDLKAIGHIKCTLKLSILQFLNGERTSARQGVDYHIIWYNCIRCTAEELWGIRWAFGFLRYGSWTTLAVNIELPFVEVHRYFIISNTGKFEGSYNQGRSGVIHDIHSRVHVISNEQQK